jgi:hypothetical protein
MRARPVLLISLLGTAVLAAGVVTAATRAYPGTASLVALPRAGGAGLEPTPVPTSPPTPAPSPSGPYVLTPPEPPHGQGVPSTPDPERPPGYPLPTGCLSFFHSCAYYGATGAVTAGPDWMDCPSVGPGSVRLHWRTENLTPQLSWSTPTEFVVRAYLRRDKRDEDWRDPSRLTQARLPVSAFSYTFTGLEPDGVYLFAVLELNSSGLAGIACDPLENAFLARTRTPAPITETPAPALSSPAPTPTSSLPTPDPAPSETPPTPTATVEP